MTFDEALDKLVELAQRDAKLTLMPGDVEEWDAEDTRKALHRARCLVSMMYKTEKDAVDAIKRALDA